MIEITATRKAIRLVGEEFGWTTVYADKDDIFERTLTIDPEDKLARLAAHLGYDLKERVSVSYSPTDGQRLYSAWHFTPEHQAAIDGRFIDCEHITGPMKRGTIEALTRKPWTPSR